MKIGLFGYGRMGQLIGEIAQSRGHEIVWKITSKNIDEVTPALLQQSDVIIEFTHPEAGFHHVYRCIAAGVPTISGTTGWTEKLPEIQRLVSAKNGRFIYASNFSLGVNLFFKINQYVAKLMNAQLDYEVSIHEIHHTAKKDAPSGTAITLGQQIVEQLDRKTGLDTVNAEDAQLLKITSERIDPAPGTHIISYENAIDEIQLSHIAKNRNGFALGAVIAAEWLVNQPSGNYGMSDVLNL